MTIAAVRNSEGQFSGNSAQKDRWEHCKTSRWQCWFDVSQPPRGWWKFNGCNNTTFTYAVIHSVQNLYIIIGLWIWPRAWLMGTDQRQARLQAAGADGRHAQTGCGSGQRERGRHGVWLTAGGQATIELWLVLFKLANFVVCWQ